MTGISSKGGLTRIVFDKINYLVKKNDIHVVYFGRFEDKPFYIVNERVHFHPISGVDAYSKFTKKIRQVFKIVQAYRHIIKEVEPDIIINANANILSWIIPCVNRKIPKIVELHQSRDGVEIFNNNAYGKNSLKSRFLFMLRDIMYPRYDRVVVLTSKDVQQWGYKNMDVIPNFTNFQNNTIHFNEDVKNILWIGRLSHQKGVDLLIEIWAKFLKINSTWTLTIIGDDISKSAGDLKQRVIEYASNPVHRVTHIKDTKDVQSYYKKASLFISTSRFEGLPLVLIEAATMGLPICGFRITGNDCVIQDGVNGVMVNPYSVEMFVSELKSLCENFQCRRAYGGASIELSRNFSKEYIMEKWTNLFNTLALSNK